MLGLEQLRQQRAELQRRVPAEQVERTISALGLWVDSAEAGKISHGFVVARRPAT